MADYTKLNLKSEVENMAPGQGMPDGMEARFANKPLGLDQLGVSHQQYAAGVREPFGHSHQTQEEIYYVLGGSGTAALDDELVELEQGDTLRVGAGTMRSFEGGPDGIELLAFGAPALSDGENDAEMEMGWWPAS